MPLKNIIGAASSCGILESSLPTSCPRRSNTTTGPAFIGSSTPTCAPSSETPLVQNLGSRQGQNVEKSRWVQPGEASVAQSIVMWRDCMPIKLQTSHPWRAGVRVAECPGMALDCTGVLVTSMWGGVCGGRRGDALPGARWVRV